MTDIANNNSNNKNMTSTMVALFIAITIETVTTKRIASIAIFMATVLAAGLDGRIMVVISIWHKS